MDNNNLPAVWGAVGPGVAGAVFGAAWWFWVDAIVCSAAAVPFLHYLPGDALPPASFAPSPPTISLSPKVSVFNHFVVVGLDVYLGFFASFAALMFNSVKREDINDNYYSPYDDSEWRLKLWLFISYVVSFVSLAAAVGFLVQDALTDTGPSAWTGIAGVLQTVFVLISGLIYWTCHSED